MQRFDAALGRRFGLGSRLAFYFLAFAVPWIFLGDYLVWRYAEAIDGQFVQTTKGLVFVALGALLLKVVADRMAARLRSLHERERRMVEQLGRAQKIGNIGSWEVDFATGKLSWSDQVLAIFEMDRRAFGGTEEAFSRLVHPEDRAGLWQARQAWLEAGGTFDYEHRIVTPSGRTKWVRERAEVIHDALGKPRFTTGTVQDVTERKEAEHQEALLRMAARTAKFGGWRYEKGADRVMWSDGTARIHDEPAGTHPLLARAIDYYAPEGRQRVIRRFRACLERGEAYDEVFRLITATGRERFARAIGEPEYDAQGRIVAARGGFQDVTDLRALDAQLHHAQKLETVGQLTGGVAHDFNNLLTIILGNAELLEMDARDETTRESARIIVQAAERGADLTANLLAFARRQPLQPRPTDLNALIRDSAALFHQGVHEGITVEFHLAADAPVATIDPNKLQAALLNLVVNSRHALVDHGTIRITTANVQLEAAREPAQPSLQPGAYVAVTVTDDGPGMSAEVVDQAFDPFFTTKPAGRGTGLGLSSVYGFAKQSGGDAVINSRPGGGTSITLYLPRAQRPASMADDQGPPNTAPGRGQHVLLVEDDDALRAHTAGQLRRMGYRVTPTADAEEALQRLGTIDDVDLLFTDVMMPGGMNGRELAEAARARFANLPVLFTSGYTDDVVLHEGRLDAGVDLLSKPYRYDDLARQLERMFAEKARGQRTPI
ncbi:MAG: PAS domain-containing protein [Pseudomonadota bacterium]